jgi:DNA gyrase/topoisomerase IV subunit B
MVYIHSKKKKKGYKKKFIFDEGIEEFGSYMANEHSLKTTSHNNFKKRRTEYRVRSELHLQVMIDGQIIFQKWKPFEIPPTFSLFIK